MNIQLIFTSLALFFHYSVSAETLSEITLPDIEPMQGMSTIWIAKKIIYNTHPMSIRHFRCVKSSKEVVHYYASKWKVSGHGELTHKQIGEYKTIGYAHNGYAYSVQVKDIGNRSEGKFVVTRNRAVKKYPIALPIHTDSKIVSRIHSLDMGLESETITLSMNMSMNANRHWFHASFIKDGWIKQDNLTENNKAPHIYQKGKQLCQLIFIDKSSVANHLSMVMIHWIKG